MAAAPARQQGCQGMPLNVADVRLAQKGVAAVDGAEPPTS
jgi:hypothetical protein